MGTRGAVTIEATTDEPQTRARGEQFARIVGDTLTEARALVEARLREAGFTDLNVWIDMGQTDLGYWFDASVAVDVYELRNRDLNVKTPALQRQQHPASPDRSRRT
jgi:hypothetical protein